MNNKKTVAFYTLGCKLNFSETSTISRMFPEDDFQKVEFEEPADIYVINTCSVTENADKKCKTIVKQALKKSPDAFVAIIGCFAQLKPETIANIPGVNLVLGTSEKFTIVQRINEIQKESVQSVAEVFVDEIKHCNSFTPSFSANDRTRSFLKIQDGCDYFCSFCTIPLARGKSRSDTIENTVALAKQAIATGVKEIVLTGVNIGDFGKKKLSPTHSKGRGEETFFDLIKALDSLSLEESRRETVRFRISSIEPNLLLDEIIEFVAQSKRFMPHFHIPLQSGNNKILQLMRRRYERELYAERIAKIKSLMPHCCIGADVIVGFPDETEEDFLETYCFINELDVSYLHVFTYSERENTTALRIANIVPMEERNKRSKMLHILSEKKRRYFYEQHIGSIADVLFEKENDDGVMVGFTENYIKVKTNYNDLLVNNITKVKLAAIAQDGEMMNCYQPI